MPWPQDPIVQKRLYWAQNSHFNTWKVKSERREKLTTALTAFLHLTGNLLTKILQTKILITMPKFWNYCLLGLFWQYSILIRNNIMKVGSKFVSLTCRKKTLSLFCKAVEGLGTSRSWLKTAALNKNLHGSVIEKKYNYVFQLFCINRKHNF